jgi:hypothetical protein
VDAEANPYQSPAPPELLEAPALADSSWIPRVASGLATIAAGMSLGLLTTILYYTSRSQVAIPPLTAYVAANFMYCAARLWFVVGVLSCRATPGEIAPQGLLRFLIAMNFLSFGLRLGELACLIGNSATIPSWLYNLSVLAAAPASLAFGWYSVLLARSIGSVAIVRNAWVTFTTNATFRTAEVGCTVYAWVDPLPRGALALGIERLVFFVSSVTVTALFINLTIGLRKALLARIQPIEASGDKLSPNDDRAAAASAIDAPPLPARVATGLAASWLGIVVLLAALAAPTARWISPEFGWTRANVSAAVEVIVMTGLALKLFGALLCISVPDKANARLPAQIAAGSAALCLFLMTSAYFAARGVLRPFEFRIDIPVVLLDSVSSLSLLV